MRLLGSEYKTAGIWLAICIWLFLEVALLLDLLHLGHAFDAVHIGLAIVGGVFAVLAMMDAHRAFSKAQEVQEATGSFRMSFSAVMEEMVEIIENAQVNATVLVPTPGYGFLFGQRQLSSRFVQALEDFVTQRGGQVDLYLVVGTTDPISESVPQQYLWRAYELQTNGTGSKGVVYEEYRQLVERVFLLHARSSGSMRIHVLESDPSVRLILADVEDSSNRVCLLSFAQLEPLNTQREFESKGFMSRRTEMVRAVQDLVTVYQSSERVGEGTHDIRSLFTTLLT